MMRLDLPQESLIIAPTPRTLLTEISQGFFVHPNNDDITPDIFILKRLSLKKIVCSSLDGLKPWSEMKQKNSSERKKDSNNKGFAE